MKLTDLMPAEEWAGLENELEEKFGLKSTVYTPDGMSFTGRHVFVNSLCETIKGSPAALSTICAAASQNFIAEAGSTGRAVIGECDAGLAKVAVPVLIGGEFLGVVGGCGLLPEGGEAEEFLVQKTTGLPEERVSVLCSALGEIGAETLDCVVRFIEQRLSEIKARAGLG